MTGRVAFDFDGTLYDPHTQLWIPGARSAIEDVRARGYQPFIHTCRANWPEGAAEVAAALRAAHLDLDVVAKPDARWYIDNQGIRFTGDWRQTLRDIPPTAKTVRDLMAR